MLSRNQIKFIRSLHLRKYRDLQRLFIAEGVKVVTELLEGPFHVSAIYYDPGKAGEEAVKAFRNAEVHLFEVCEEEMKKITALATPGPALALVQMADDPPEIHLVPDNLILVLDDIRDPGNMGTIIRIADWFGIHSIITSLGSVDIYNPKVVQATMGSLARVKVRQTHLPDYLSSLPEDIPVYGTFLDGASIYDEKPAKNGIIIIGNESSGISEPVAQFVNRRISIPPWDPARHAESLNASVATAIVCAEFRRTALL